MEQWVEFAVVSFAVVIATRRVAMSALSPPPRRWVGVAQLAIIVGVWWFGSFIAALVVAALFSYGARVFIALMAAVFDVVHR